MLFRSALVGLSFIKQQNDSVSLSSDGVSVTLDGQIVGNIQFAPIDICDMKEKDSFSVASSLVYSLLPETKRREFLKNIGTKNLGNKMKDFWKNNCTKLGLTEGLANLLSSILSRKINANIYEIKEAIEQSIGYVSHGVKVSDQYPSNIDNNLKLNGIEIAFLRKPFEEVSGDFDDYIKISENEHGFLIGDVMGHGLRACLIRHLIQPIPHFFSNLNPTEVIKKMHEQLDYVYSKSTTQKVYSTASYGIINLTNKKFSFSNAGHPIPLLIRGGKVSQLKLEDNPFVGNQMGT